MDSIETVADRWNEYSKVYSEDTEYGTLQSATVIQNLSLSRLADRIFDAGWGPGLSALSFCSTVMKRGAKLYSADISPEMLDIFKTRFELSDFCLNPDNWIRKINETDVDSEEKIFMLETDGRIGPKGKGVFLLEWNIEQLPFPDNWFDAYTANLALQITPNHIQMLKECYRVLKSNCKAAFAVWGREEMTTFITFMPEILEKYGVTDKPEKYLNFHLSDIDQLTEDAKSIGFSSVKAFYMPTKYAIFTGEEMLNFLKITPVKKEFERFDAETKVLVEKDIVETFDKRFGSSTTELSTFEILILVCVK